MVNQVSRIRYPFTFPNKMEARGKQRLSIVIPVRRSQDRWSALLNSCSRTQLLWSCSLSSLLVEEASEHSLLSQIVWGNKLGTKDCKVLKGKRIQKPAKTTAPLKICVRFLHGAYWVGLSPWGFTTSLNRSIRLLLKHCPPLHPCSALVLATLASPSAPVQTVVKGTSSSAGRRTCPFSVVTHG